jgi:RNA polymerase sigma-70 factor (ECF subfamily)
MLNVARNLAIDKTRSKEIKKARKTDNIDPLVHRIDREHHAMLSVEAIGLKQVMQQLPEEQRFVVEYLYLKGYTQSELANEFTIPLGTVKTRLRLAMVELRTLLNVT